MSTFAVHAESNHDVAGGERNEEPSEEELHLVRVDPASHTFVRVDAKFFFVSSDYGLE